MQISIPDNSKRSLLEIQISFHGELLREFFFSRNGLWRYVFTGLGMAFFMLFFCGLQSTWFHYFPEVPLYPVVIFFAFLAIRYSLLAALFLAFPAGILLDSALFLPVGTHCVLLMLSAFSATLLPKGWNLNTRLVATIPLACGNATVVYVLLRIFFFSNGLSAVAKIQVLPEMLLLGLLVNAFAAGPAIFSIFHFFDYVLARK